MKKAKTSLVGYYAFAFPAEKMKERIDNAKKALEAQGVEVNFCGYFSDHDEESIKKVKDRLDSSAFDSSSITLVVAAWMESPPVFRVLANHKHVPILMWTISGYRTGNPKDGLISPGDCAGSTGLNFSFMEFGYKHLALYDIVDIPSRAKEAADFIKFAEALKTLKNTRVCSIGYADMHLYPLMYNGNTIMKYTGVHVDNIDFYDVWLQMQKVTEKEAEEFIKDFKTKVCYEKEPNKRDFDTLAKSYLAINKIIEEKDYKGLTLKCIYGMSRTMNFSPCMIQSLIADRIDTICECDVYGMLNLVIIRALTGKVGVFQEFMEFYKNSMLTAICGFAPFSLCDEKCVKVQGHSWGGAGGIMNISKLKQGRITLTKMYEVKGEMHMHAVTGNSKVPERWQEDGWEDHKGPNYPAMEITLDTDLNDFQKYIAGQHYIVSYGDNTEIFERFCQFTGIKFNRHKEIDFKY